MPKLGMAGSSVMLKPWLEAVKIAAANGFDAIEVFGEFPCCVCDQATREQREEARAVIEKAGLAVAVHAPFTSLNLAAMNPGVRQLSVQQTKDAMDLCADLGGGPVIVHNGEYTFRRFSGLIQWKINIQSLQELAAYAANKSVTMCLENIGFEPDHMDQCVDDMLRVRDEAGEPLISFCLDIGHARLNHELPEAIAKMGPHIRHIHFTDNFGEHDDHLPIGEGDFDYAPHLDFFRSFGGIITLEVVKVGEDPEPAIKSLEYVRRLLA
jgi:sugar phosphate isomerase/epimerase